MEIKRGSVMDVFTRIKEMFRARKVEQEILPVRSDRAVLGSRGHSNAKTAAVGGKWGDCLETSTGHEVSEKEISILAGT